MCAGSMHATRGPGRYGKGVFAAPVVEPAAYFIDCMRYIELHPARSGLVEEAAAYPWSSLQHHLAEFRPYDHRPRAVLGAGKHAV